MKKLNQQGSHLIIGLLVFVVIGVVVFVGIKVTRSQNSSSQLTAPESGASTVQWRYDESKKEYIVVSGTAPECAEPFHFDRSPIDVSLATGVGLPGSYRSSGYKPHSGFRLDDSTDGSVEVVMPIDATLVGLTRYYEGEPAELQYLLTFETDCGIAFRFDHLYTLAPAFQAIAETTPEPRLNDTRTNPDDAPDPVKFKAGDVVATRVGFPRVKNFGFDFGAYDYRSRNEISGNAKWAAIHEQYSSLDWHGVCWIDMLPLADVDKARQLTHVQIDTRKPLVRISDYCKDAEYTTLDFNDGKQPSQEL